MTWAPIMSSVIIVVPCYSEAKRLSVQQFKAFSLTSCSIQFLFVNDGSTDGTIKLLECLHKCDPQRFTVCNLPENVGKAEAVRQGLLQAFNARPEYVGYWDADLATPLTTIPVFYDLLNREPALEMVFGAMVLLLGRSIERKAVRHYLGRLFATAASIMLGINIYDTQCGAKLFRASPLIKSLFQQPFETEWIFDIEIIARLIQACEVTCRSQPEHIIYEFPLDEWHDIAGSKVKLRDFGKAFFHLSKIYWKYFVLRQTNGIISETVGRVDLEN
jgi:dolichyl-phosphate beta-glucosyltransferase